MKNKKMTRKQKTSLDFFLTEYPQNWTFEQVLEGIESESEKITVWEKFEFEPTRELIKEIKLNAGIYN